MMSVINDSIKQFLAGIATIMHIYLGQVLYIVVSILCFYAFSHMSFNMPYFLDMKASLM